MNVAYCNNAFRNNSIQLWKYICSNCKTLTSKLKRVSTGHLSSEIVEWNKLPLYNQFVGLWQTKQSRRFAEYTVWSFLGNSGGSCSTNAVHSTGSKYVGPWFKRKLHHSCTCFGFEHGAVRRERVFHTRTDKLFGFSWWPTFTLPISPQWTI